MIPLLHPREEEMLVPMVKAFMKTYGFRDCILDGEGGIIRFCRYLYNYMCFDSALFVLGWCPANIGE